MRKVWTVDLHEFRRRLLDEAPDAIVISDPEGIIRFWNPGAVRIFGFTSQEALGRSLDIIIPVALRERHWQGYTQTIRTGQTRYGAGDVLAVPALRKDGMRISVEFSIIPFRDAAGRIAGMGAVLRDVTKRFEELKALRKQVSVARAQAGERRWRAASPATATSRRSSARCTCPTTPVSFALGSRQVADLRQMIQLQQQIIANNARMVAGPPGARGSTHGGGTSIWGRRGFSPNELLMDRAQYRGVNFLEQSLGEAILQPDIARTRFRRLDLSPET